jgi:dipeptidyl aminopeptidase/acylaminoacyl peptidase
MVYVVEGDAEPRLLHETGRRLSGLAWRPDGESLLVAARSKKIDPPPEARGPYYIQALRGLLELDAQDGTVQAEWMQEVTHDLFPSPADDRAVLQASDGKLYLLEPSGPSLKLEGLGDRLAFAGWSPKGDSMLVFSYETVTHPHPVDGRLYVVPLTDGEALGVEPPLDDFQRESASWAPDGSRFAFVAGAQFNDFEGWRARGDLYVYEVATGVTSRLTSERGYGGTRPVWSRDGALLTIDGDLIDVAGGLVASPAQPPMQPMGAAISPDGRYFVVAEDPYAGDPLPCPQDRLRNRTHVYDAQTGGTRIALDCDDGYHVVRTWDFAWSRAERWLAGGRELVVHTTPIYCCHTSPTSLSILNVETGELRTLIERDEGNLDAEVSPDGARVLVRGGGPRVFAADGSLLRAFEVPEGYEVYDVAWSPDGTKFAYLVVPLSFFDGV